MAAFFWGGGCLFLVLFFFCWGTVCGSGGRCRSEAETVVGLPPKLRVQLTFLTCCVFAMYQSHIIYSEMYIVCVYVCVFKNATA